MKIIRPIVSWNPFLIARIVVYYTATFYLFLVSFVPELLYLWFLIGSNNVWLYIATPVILFVLYFCSCLIFAITHSSVTKLMLPAPKIGWHDRATWDGKLQGVRLSADHILKSMVSLLNFVPFVNQLFLFAFFLRFYGLKVGKNVYISRTAKFDSALLTLGDGSFVGQDAILSCHVNDRNMLYIDRLTFGRNCMIGGRSVFMPGTVVSDDVTIGTNAIVTKKIFMPAGSIWVGVPARMIRSSPNWWSGRQKSLLEYL